MLVGGRRLRCRRLRGGISSEEGGLEGLVRRIGKGAEGWGGILWLQQWR